MMISPENFYKERLEGKTVEQIITEIRSLERWMVQLKCTIDNPDRADGMCPTEETRLLFAEIYLEKARQALAEAGGTYEPMDAVLIEQICLLQDELDADDLTEGKAWNGYDVLIPEYDEEAFIGLPLVILIKDGTARISTSEESRAYLEYVTKRSEL